MKIGLVTPAAKGSRSGNRVTAVRWATLLRQLGHDVSVNETLRSAPTDLLIAIHAYRTAEWITAWRHAHPERPLIVLLAGTDIYRFQHSHPRTTLASMEAADRLVGLHDSVADDIPTRFHDKLRIVYQSAAPLPGPRRPSKRTVDFCVVGHLRDEKDPLRAARAARSLPSESKVRVIHLGKAHDAKWASEARAETANNPRYIWRGEVPHGLVRRCFAHCHAMVISSLMEGGANVVSEAAVAHLPILASHIAGNVGLLGTGHPAYFSPQDTAALAGLMHRVETDALFAADVCRSVTSRAPLFRAEREAAAWQQVIEELR